MQQWCNDLCRKGVWNLEFIPACAAYESLRCFFNVFDKTEGGILLTAVNSFYLVWSNGEMVIFEPTMSFSCCLMRSDGEKLVFRAFSV